MAKKIISRLLIITLVTAFSTQHIAMACDMNAAKSSTLAAAIQVNQRNFQQAAAVMFYGQAQADSAKSSFSEGFLNRKNDQKFPAERITNVWSKLKNHFLKLSSLRKPQRRAFITAALVMIFVFTNANVFALDSAAFLLENDGSHFFLRGPGNFTDEQYTSGAKLTLLSEPSAVSSSSWNNKLPLLDTGDRLSFSDFSFGQLIYTPNATESYQEERNDRPYAGIAYLEWGVNSFDKKSITSLILDVGLIGPWAMAEETQNTVHNIAGFEETNGWEYQIGNHFLMMGGISHTRKIADINVGNLFGSDVLLHGGAGAGNWLVYGNIGAELRVGFNLDSANRFGNLSTRLDRGMFNPAPVDYKHRKYSGKFLENLQLFVGGQLHGIAYDATVELEGHDITGEPLVGSFTAGIAAALNIFDFGPINIIAATTVRTERFQEQGGNHYFSTFMVNIPLEKSPAKITARPQLNDKFMLKPAAVPLGFAPQHFISQSI